MIKIVDRAQEAIDKVTPSPEATKAAALNTCHSAIEMCKGGTIKGEIGRLASACVSLPVGVAAAGLKTCSKLLKPGEALCEAAKGLKDACVTTTEIVTSPARFAGATAKTGVSAVKTGARATKRAVKAVAEAPFTVPAKFIDVVGGGVEKVENMFGIGGPSTPAPVEEKESAPPPMAEAA
jgi:hypothetical protein